jgi:methylthioribose-1-phosphate isomerase
MRTIEWKDGVVCMIDQTKLPSKVSIVRCSDHECVARAIETMQIRGAPAIGVAAAMGVALAAEQGRSLKLVRLKEKLGEATARLSSTRPTARNLFWALQRMERVWKGTETVDTLVAAVVKEAKAIAEEDVVLCRLIGSLGAALIEDGDRILTHCNAGGLACVEHGTALGVIRSAFIQGKKIFVYATETRPLLQGARLTAFELKSEGIPFKLITDSMVGHVMRKGLVDKVIVGADRITREGDVVNKIGTYGIAVLAKFVLCGGTNLYHRPRHKGRGYRDRGAEGRGGALRGGKEGGTQRGLRLEPGLRSDPQGAGHGSDNRGGHLHPAL